MSSDDKDVFYRCFPRHIAADFHDIGVCLPLRKAGTRTFNNIWPTVPEASPRWHALNTLPGLEPTTRPLGATHVLIPIQDGLPRYVTDLASVPMGRCVPTDYCIFPGAWPRVSLGSAKCIVTTTTTVEYVEKDQ